MMTFDNQVVWITGASSGIGEALALAFARAGATLVLSARRPAELARVAAACGVAKTLVLPLDLAADPSTLTAAVETVRKKLGRIDVMVHNAGMSSRSRVEDTSLEVYRRVMEVNYFGTVALTRAVLPVMLAQGSGRFVVVTSVAGKLGTQLRSAYCASKHALHGFFDCLRAEVADRGVGVTLVCPGYVVTPLSLHALRGDGSVLGTMAKDIASGASTTRVADQILRAVAAERSESYVGRLGTERIALWLKRFAPRALERVTRSHVPT